MNFSCNQYVPDKRERNPQIQQGRHPLGEGYADVLPPWADQGVSPGEVRRQKQEEQQRKFAAELMEQRQKQARPRIHMQSDVDEVVFGHDIDASNQVVPRTWEGAGKSSKALKAGHYPFHDQNYRSTSAQMDIISPWQKEEQLWLPQQHDAGPLRQEGVAKRDSHLGHHPHSRPPLPLKHDALPSLHHAGSHAPPRQHPPSDEELVALWKLCGNDEASMVELLARLWRYVPACPSEHCGARVG